MGMWLYIYIYVAREELEMDDGEKERIGLRREDRIGEGRRGCL